MQVLEPRFQNAFQLPASPLWNIPATMEIWARLANDERPHGEAQPVTRTEAPDT